MSDILIIILFSLPLGAGTCIFMLGVSGWLDKLDKPKKRFRRRK